MARRSIFIASRAKATLFDEVLSEPYHKYSQIWGCRRDMPVRKIKRKSLLKSLENRNVTFLFSLIALLIPIFLYEVSGWIWPMAGGAAFACALCAYGSCLQLQGAELNVPDFFCRQTLMWYVLPFTYYPFLDPRTIETSTGELITAVFTVVAMTALAFPVSYLSIAKISFRKYAMLSGGNTRIVAALIGIVVSLQLYLILSGQWGLSKAFSAQGEENLVSQLTFNLSTAIAPTATFLWGRIRRRSSIGGTTTSVALWAVIGLQAMWWFTIGRRSLAIEGMLSIFAYSLAVYGPELRGRAMRFLLIAAAISVPATLFIWASFFTLRVATYSFTTNADLRAVSTSELIQMAGNVSDYDKTQGFSENLSTRPFIIQSVAVVQNSANGFLFGTDFTSNFLAAVPNALWPSKRIYMSENGSEELIWARELGVPFNDWANTALLGGYTDFGFFGFLIYCLTVSAICQAVWGLTGYFPVRSIRPFVFYGIAATLMFVESPLVGIFVDMRTMVIVILAAAALEYVTRHKRLPVRAIRLRAAPKKFFLANYRRHASHQPVSATRATE